MSSKEAMNRQEPVVQSANCAAKQPGVVVFMFGLQQQPMIMSFPGRAWMDDVVCCSMLSMIVSVNGMQHPSPW